MSNMDSPSQEDPRIQEITLKYFNEIASCKKELETMKAKYRPLQTQLDISTVRNKSLENKLADCQKKLEAANKKNASFHEDYWKLVEVEKAEEMEDLKKKLEEFQKQHDKEIGGKDLKIQTLELELSAVQKKSSEKILELQEQNIKKFSGKDLEIQQLEITLAAAKKEISERKSEEPGQLHIDLGKLYVDLQEAKKPQETLMAQLAAKDKEMENLTDQLEAKDSEIQNRTEKIENLQEIIYDLQMTKVAKDKEIGKMTERLADLEAELACYM
ncbi:hypothetical protein GCK72_015905 [Caenorhabditis remanei]|uniref:Uncharacterized protein n=1 Tax=Caenorhabditis remanei TaxID=31234 RepID=A0A6A5GVD8_CAERE|nr:hypothetical protein GCK72_015905 [Caenorhabditis remanei]KAF1759438.1 hypothetical protein GCK72_015905 [Caenorhabditis remanei]